MGKLTRREALRLLALAGAGALAGLSSACNSSPPAPAAPPGAGSTPAASAPRTNAFEPLRQPVKIVAAQAADSLTFTPLYLAEAQGFFTEENLQVERTVVTGGPKVTAALLAGSVQFGSSAFTDTVDAARQGAPVVSVAGTISPYAINVVLNKKVADRLGVSADTPVAAKAQALKGLRIGISSPGSGSDQLARFLLTQAGLDPDRDAELVAMDPVGPMDAALLQGTIDAGVTVSPAVEQAVANGSSIVFISPAKGDIPQLKDALYADVRTTRPYAQANPDTVAAFVRAIAKAERFATSDKDAAGQVLRTYFSKMDQTVFDLAWKDQAAIISKTPVIDVAGAQRTMDFDNAFASTKLNASVESLIDDRFAQAAAEAIR